MKLQQQKAILESLISIDYSLQVIEASGVFNGKEKSFIKNFKNTLATKLKAADEMFNKATSSADDVQNAYQLMIEGIARIGIEHSGEIGVILTAYKKDPKSILGIANKILR